MLNFNQLISPVLIISLMLPVSGFAQSNAATREQAQQANLFANKAISELQHNGTEFYLDAAKKKQVNPRDLTSLNRNGSKLYVVAPYDRNLNTRVAFSESFKITQKGELKLTIEILKNEANGMKPYPIRAIKSVITYGQDYTAAKIETQRAIQAALNIAKGQMSVSSKKMSTFESFASKALEAFFPSAIAGITDVIANIIMVAAGVVLIKYGFNFFTSKSSEDYEILRFIIGGALMMMGYKLARAGIDPLMAANKK